MTQSPKTVLTPDRIGQQAIHLEGKLTIHTGQPNNKILTLRIANNSPEFARLAQEEEIANFGIAVLVELDPTATIAVGETMTITQLYETEFMVLRVTQENVLKRRNWINAYGKAHQLYLFDSNLYDLPDYSEQEAKVTKGRGERK